MSHSTCQSWVPVVTQSTVLQSEELGGAKTCQWLWAGCRVGVPLAPHPRQPRPHAALSPLCHAPCCFFQPQAAVPRGVPAPGAHWVLTSEPTGKPCVNHSVLMHEVIEQSCTDRLGICMPNNGRSCVKCPGAHACPDGAHGHRNELSKDVLTRLPCRNNPALV